MSELHLQGYLKRDWDGNAEIDGSTVAKSVLSFADDIENGLFWQAEEGLGEDHCVIKDVNARMYVTDEECSLEDAEIALLDKFEGVCQTEVSLSGYSEWTITGMDVDEFKIGGHDIEQILQSNIGKYVHFIIEC